MLFPGLQGLGRQHVLVGYGLVHDRLKLGGGLVGLCQVKQIGHETIQLLSGNFADDRPKNLGRFRMLFRPGLPDVLAILIDGIEILAQNQGVSAGFPSRPFMRRYQIPARRLALDCDDQLLVE